MMRTFIIETGESLTGPWQSIQKYRADIIGPEEPNEPGRIVTERASYFIALCFIVIRRAARISGILCFIQSELIVTDVITTVLTVVWLQFWRIVIADNYGAEITSFHGLKFYGVGKCFLFVTIYGYFQNRLQ